MRNMSKLKVSLMAVVLVGVISISGVDSASAGSRCRKTDHCCYRQVTTYQCQKERRTVYSTRYDHCGNPYVVKKICYHTVKVPVTRWVKVCH